MEKPLRKIHRKTRPEPDSSNFLVIYTLLFVIIAIFIATYYKKLKQRCGYLLKNLRFKNLYINLLDDPLENTDEFNKKAKKIIHSYGPFMYIQNINHRILNIVNFKYSLSSFLNEIHSPFSFLKKIEDYIESIDYEIPKKINNINKVRNKNKGKSPKSIKDNNNGSNHQVNIQKKKKKQRQRLVYPDSGIASTSSTTVPSSPVPIFYESFIIQKASTSTTSSSGTSLVTTVASIASSSTSTSSATTISSKSLSSSRKTLVASTPSITSINNMSYKSTSSIVSIVSENDKKKTYPIKNIEEKKQEEVEIEGINNHKLHTEDIIAITTTTSTPSITIPSVPSTVVIQEIKDEEDDGEEEIKPNETKNVIKYTQPTASIDAISISSHSSIVGDDEDTCYDSYISSDVSDNYSSTSELSDSEDDVIILINPEPDLSQFLSPRKNQNKTESVNNNNNQKSYIRNDKFNKINGDELKKHGQPLFKKEGMRKSYNEIDNKRNSMNYSMSRRKDPSNNVKNNNNNSMSKKSINSSTSSLQTLISSHDDLIHANNHTANKNISLSPKPTTDMILSSFKEPYLVKSIISTTSSIQQSPSLSVSSVFSEQSDSSSATLVHPSYSQISTTSTFSTKDTLTASTTELTVKSSAILDKEQGQNVSPNINVNISINNNSSTTTSPLSNKTTTVNKSSVFYSSGPMRVSRRNRHYYPSVVSHSRSYGSSSLMQRHMIKPIRRGKNYGGNGPQGYTYYIPQHYLRNNSNGTMTSPYCPLIYNAATPYIITTPNAQGLPVLSPMILYPTQAVATVVSSTPFNNSNYIIINNAPNLHTTVNSSSVLSTSSSINRYGGYKRFNNNNKKRRIFIPYFKKNNGHYYHNNNNNNNNNYTYKINNKNLITNTSNDNVSSNKENINRDTTSNSKDISINKENNRDINTSSNVGKEIDCKTLSEMDINNNDNEKSLFFSGERRLFKSKRLNNQRIQKKNPFNMHKPPFHKTFKKSPIKTDSEYYYQPIPVIAQQQPNLQYVYFNNNNINKNNKNNKINKNNKNNNSQKEDVKRINIRKRQIE
ncbi:hypothetical protein PIROE2DRAFT_12519 [Piromyces sp. E2]|nr:hypothetical protein PIROE2DRAFT_12519 [Piromyces sp. E2]|eukprot:OUM61467.1 hypothetical protein PIROE2DRAFT_12519 [Piromyces sp. E2]